MEKLSPYTSMLKFFYSLNIYQNGRRLLTIVCFEVLINLLLYKTLSHWICTRKSRTNLIFTINIIIGSTLQIYLGFLQIIVLYFTHLN